MRRSGGRGFTLLEVMIALVIVSLGMMAVNTQMNRYAMTAKYMEDKTLASWVGANKIAELSVAPEWPELGEDTEVVEEFAGRNWILTIEISATDVENLRRVDVDVAEQTAPDVVVHRISGLIEPPAPQGFGSVRWSSQGASR
jgi:general secretion pathway protein I